MSKWVKVDDVKYLHALLEFFTQKKFESTMDKSKVYILHDVFAPLYFKY